MVPTNYTMKIKIFSIKNQINYRQTKLQNKIFKLKIGYRNKFNFQNIMN